MKSYKKQIKALTAIALVLIAVVFIAIAFTPLVAQHRFSNADSRAKALSAAKEMHDRARININTAGKEELQTLPGIGEARALNIIAYRSKHGAFAEKSELKQVEGIGNKVYEQVKDKICVK